MPQRNMPRHLFRVEKAGTIYRRKSQKGLDHDIGLAKPKMHYCLQVDRRCQKEGHSNPMWEKD